MFLKGLVGVFGPMTLSAYDKVNRRTGEQGRVARTNLHEGSPVKFLGVNVGGYCQRAESFLKGGRGGGTYCPSAPQLSFRDICRKHLIREEFKLSATGGGNLGRREGSFVIY